MITTHMIEAKGMGQTDTVPANDRLYGAQWAVARLNRFNGVTFEYFPSREDADRSAAACVDWFQAVEIVPTARRLRNDAEIAVLTADAEKGDDEAGMFLALWPSVLKTTGKSAGQEN